MVIGNGMIAKKFLEYDDESIIFFASGVSNSKETDNSAFKREEKLLLNMIKRYPDKFFVYFSSCDIENPKLSGKPYYCHKLKMEKIIISSIRRYCIFRLPQVVGKSVNSYTLVNYFVNKIQSRSSFELWAHTKKNIIDLDDVFIIISYIMKNELGLNVTCNIINSKYISALELVHKIEQYFNLKAIYDVKDKDLSYYYDSTCMDKIELSLKADFQDDYVQKLLMKYY